MTQPAVLIKSWRAESLASAWSDAAYWWSPAVDALADALADAVNDSGSDPRAASDQLGRQRAAAGIYLDEARADVEVAARLAGLPSAQIVDLVDALTIGWIDRMLDTYFTSACVDPLTGLASLPYLLTRLAEVYAEARQRQASVPEEFAFVVVQTTGGRAPIDSNLQLTAVQAALRSAFAGGQTLAQVGPSCAVALVRRDDEHMITSLVLLHAEIGEAERERRVSRPRIWIERLPDRAEDLPAQLRQLMI
jgi:hypothetical protein